MHKDVVHVLLIEEPSGPAPLAGRLTSWLGGAGGGGSRYELQCKNRFEDGLWALSESSWSVVLVGLPFPDEGEVWRIRRLRAAAPDVPIVVLSGSNDDRLGPLAAREGAQDCISQDELNRSVLLRSIRYAVERKRAEEKLREQSEEVAAIIENTPMVIFVADQFLRVRKCNGAAAALSGLSPLQVNGLCLGRLVRCPHWPELPGGRSCPACCTDCRLRRMIIDTIHSNIIHRKVEVTCPSDGTGEDKRVLLVSSTPLVIGAERSALVVLEEITTHLQAEREAREGLHLLQTIIDSIPTPIFYKDFRRIYRGCNSAFSQLTGRSKEEVCGRDAYAIWDSLTAQTTDKVDLDLLRNPGVRVYETKVPLLDGTVHDFYCHKATYADSEGSPAGIVGVMMDITERKRAEEERQQLTRAIEQAAESIVITDREGCIRYVNPAFMHVTGYTREEALGRNPRMLKSGKHDESFYREMWESLLKGRVWRGRMVNMKKDGTLFEEEASISPMRDGRGDIVSFVAVKRDVTHEVRLESQLRQAQKLEAIGTLAGGIAHDFNNMLGAILGFTELCLFEELPEAIHENLQHVLQGAHRAKELVKQILAFSRQSEQERKPVCLGPVIKEVSKLLRGSLPSTIEIRQKQECDGGMVMADPTQIHQILMNLSTNAAHAMRERGGVLQIGLHSIDLGPDLDESFGNLPPGRYLRLTVSDTGHGMPRDILERIFDPYFTTKDPGEGTGLGLAVVHGIVKSHEGHVSVYSEPGSGTTFHVYLRALDHPSQAGTQEVAALEKRGRGEHILIVDDEKAILDVGKRMLSRMGYRVTCRSSGIEALELFRADPFRFEAVITDQTMPQMTGLSLAAELIRVRPGVPIVLCTGFSEQVDEKKALSQGISGFLLKPVVYRELADALHRAMAEGKTGREGSPHRPPPLEEASAASGADGWGESPAISKVLAK